MNEKKKIIQEKVIHPRKGIPLLILNILVMAVMIMLFVLGCIWVSMGTVSVAVGVTIIVISSLVGYIICPILFAGFKSVRPNEAYVFTLFGKYYGTLKTDGFYFVNPFVSAVAPPEEGSISSNVTDFSFDASGKAKIGPMVKYSNKISLKTMTLNNNKQKINDKLGNPIEIGIVVIWRVDNTAKAVFDVDDYIDFLSNQCDSALRSIVRMYPYDACDDVTTEKSLRGSSQEVSAKLQKEIQSKVEIAGLEIIEARITHLAYAPEIAAAMLQRQQASAIVDARQLIVDGAVGMVEMALKKLGENDIVELDEERKAAMVSNLLVVLCGNKDAQPIVNSGSLY